MPCHQEDTSNPFFFMIQKSVSCVVVVPVSVNCGREEMYLVLLIVALKQKMMPSYGQAFDQSICESCGNCVSSCPTGALTAKDTKEYRNGKPRKFLQLVHIVGQAVR